jgi:hypothetical protein
MASTTGPSAAGRTGDVIDDGGPRAPGADAGFLSPTLPTNDPLAL